MATDDHSLVSLFDRSGADYEPYVSPVVDFLAIFLVMLVAAGVAASVLLP